MLSRVADNLFWMSRYMERAEHVARLLEVAFHLELDLHGVASASHDLHWLALLRILQQPHPEVGEQPLMSAIIASLTFDMQNATSIMCCINRSRNNARSIRGSISSDIWRELNKLYWQLIDSEFRGRTLDSPHELYQAVQTGSQMFQGVCDATLTHDEGWRFIQVGKHLERADKTLRILESRRQQLHAMVDMEPSLANLHWASVLKSCQAYQAYQRVYISRVEPERVLGFLLFNREFPNSVRFCLEAAADNLKAIGAGVDGERPGGQAARILGRAIADLEYNEPEEILRGDLSAFLHGTWQRCAQASAAVQQQYALA